MNRKNKVLAWVMGVVLSLTLMSGYVAATEVLAVINEDTVISETVAYDMGLVIAEGARVTAPEGYEVTLVVDAVEKDLEPGTYEGNVAIVVTEKNTVEWVFANHDFRQALYVEDNVVQTNKSVLGVLDGVTYDGTAASGGQVTVDGDCFNGIMVGGDSVYSITDMTYNFTGNGGNDFAGYGAAVMSTDTAEVTVDNATINTDGVISVGVFGGGASKLTVKNSTIIGQSADTTEGVNAPFMKEVPWVLGIRGNTRSTNVLGKANVTYENCYIEAESWGALSTDTAEAGATLTVIDSTAIVKENGYATYADMGVFNTYTNSKLAAPDYGLIVASGQCGALFNGGTVMTSGRFGVMWHQNQEGTVTFTDGSVLNSASTAFVVKSKPSLITYPNLIVDNAQINTANGILFHLMESDDPGMNMDGGFPPNPDTMWAEYYEIPQVVPVKDDLDITDPAVETTVEATFSNTALEGDIYNSRWTSGQNLSVTFENAVIEGIISSGTQSHKHLQPGEKIYPETREEIGEVDVLASPTVSNGMIAYVDHASKWCVTGTSYLSSLTFEAGAQVDVPDGYEAVMEVDGVATPRAPGTYTGNVVMKLVSLN